MNKSISRLWQFAQTADGLGPELIVNGSFDADTDWAKDSSWTIAGGHAIYDGISNAHKLAQSNIVNVLEGTNVRICFNILTASNRAYFKISNGDGSGIYFNYTLFNVGYHEFDVVIGSGDSSQITIFALNSGDGGAFTIDDISIREILA